MKFEIGNLVKIKKLYEEDYRSHQILSWLDSTENCSEKVVTIVSIDNSDNAILVRNSYGEVAWLRQNDVEQVILPENTAVKIKNLNQNEEFITMRKRDFDYIIEIAPEIAKLMKHFAGLQ